jgi:hypothetical protein
MGKVVFELDSVALPRRDAQAPVAAVWPGRRPETSGDEEQRFVWNAAAHP